MTDVRLPSSPAPPTVSPRRESQFSVRSKAIVAITSPLLFVASLLMALSDREIGQNHAMTDVVGQSVGAALFPVAVAFGAYKGVKPTQPRVFTGVFSVAAAFVMLSVLT